MHYCLKVYCLALPSETRQVLTNKIIHLEVTLFLTFVPHPGLSSCWAFFLRYAMKAATRHPEGWRLLSKGLKKAERSPLISKVY